MMMWWMAVAAAAPGDATVEMLRQAGMSPELAVDCHPLDQTLERAAQGAGSLPALSGLPIQADTWATLATPEGRAAYGLRGSGHLRLFTGAQGNQTTFELGFRGGEREAEQLLSLFSGSPPENTRWEGGQLVEVDGEARPPVMRELGFADGVFRLVMNASPTEQIKGPVVGLLRRGAEAEQGCVLTLGGALVEGLDVSAKALQVRFPFDGSRAIQLRVVAKGPKEALAVPESVTVAGGRTRVDPHFVGVWTAPLSQVTEAAPLPVDSVGPLLAFAGGVPSWADATGTTFATFEDEIAVVHLSTAELNAPSGSALGKWVKKSLKGTGAKVGSGPEGLLAVRRAGAPVLYVGTRDRSIVLSESQNLAAEVVADQGSPWVQQGELDLAKRSLAMVSFRAGLGGPRMTIGVTHRGGNVWEALLAQPEGEGQRDLLTLLGVLNAE